MDIHVAIDLMLSGVGEAAEVVREWVRRGGFIPEGWDRAALLAAADAVLDRDAVVTIDKEGSHA